MTQSNILFFGKSPFCENKFLWPNFVGDQQNRAKQTLLENALENILHGLMCIDVPVYIVNI
jgi:hypothetical protein